LYDDETEKGASVAARIWIPLRDRWRLLLLGSALAVTATLAAQALEPPLWTARAVLAPASLQLGTSEVRQAQTSRRADLSGVDAGKRDVGEFVKFQVLLYSDRLGVAQAARAGQLVALFPEQQDARTRSWMRPQGVGRLIGAAINPIFGLPASRPPDGHDIASRYQRDLTLRPIGKTDMIQLRFVDRDPVRAAQLLAMIIADTDALLRRDAANVASARALYLRDRLRTIPVGRSRDHVVDLLDQVEETLMLTDSSLPYSIEVLQPPSVSRTPTSQRPLLYGALALVIGFAFSAFVAVLLGPRRPRTEFDGSAGPAGPTL
jgi:uncharacterized protein involved in exopolysaccharide biosynthesis